MAMTIVRYLLQVPTIRYHTHLLQFDGQGGWSFSSFSSEVYLTP